LIKEAITSIITNQIKKEKILKYTYIHVDSVLGGQAEILKLKLEEMAFGSVLSAQSNKPKHLQKIF
jgi:hypothetical protein